MNSKFNLSQETAPILLEAERLSELGLSLQWLQKNSKKPFEKDWTKLPNKTFNQLKENYQEGYNLGCRLGLPSKFTDNTCLVVIDVDIKGGEQYAEEALKPVKELLGDDLSSYPLVKSPRGYHYYARCSSENLSPNQKIAFSTDSCEIEMNGKQESRRCWEVDFLATNKQVVLPPSIHPDTKTPYEWRTRFNTPDEIPLLSLAVLERLSHKEINNPPNDEGTKNISLIDIDINLLKIPDDLKKLIVDGAEKGKRSEAILKACIGLLNANVDDNAICSILTDARYKISEKALEERGNRVSAADWIIKYPLKTAKSKVNTKSGNAPLRALALPDFLSYKLPPRELILSPWLPKGGLCMIHARPGIGKTYLSFTLGYAVAIGGECLKWKADKPRGVLIIDGEMSAVTAQQRFVEIDKMYDCSPLSKNLRFLTPDLQEAGMPDLSTPNGQAAINELITDEIELVIVDNLSCLVRSGKENESESWLPIQQWALDLRKKGKSVLFIHHSGKNLSQRGSSKREDILDAIISLQHPLDYTQDKGACFELHFEKARALHGDDAKPFQAQLATGDVSKLCWQLSDIEKKDTAQKVAELLKSGMAQTQIAKELGINKSNVSRAVTQAKKKGLMKDEPTEF